MMVNTRPEEKKHLYALAMHGYAPIIRGAAAAQFARGYLEVASPEGKTVKVEVVGMAVEGDTIVTTVRATDEVAGLLKGLHGSIETPGSGKVTTDGAIHVHPPKPVPPPVDQPTRRPYDADKMRGCDGVPVYDLPTSHPRPDLHRPGPAKHPLEGALHKKGGIGSPPTTPKPDVVPSAQAHPACTCKPDCSTSCKGACGCEACRQDYADFLSSE